MERIELAPHSAWHLETDRETWLLGVNGDALVGLFTVVPGEAIFVQSDGARHPCGADWVDCARVLYRWSPVAPPSDPD